MHPLILLSSFLLPLYTNSWSAIATPLKLPSTSELVTYNRSSARVTSYSRPLLRRDWPQPFRGVPLLEVIGAGWAAASFEHDFIYSSDDVDRVLADFYHSIVSMCMAMTASNAPLAPYGGVFKSGGLELAFDSTGNPIPWSLLRAFADYMLLTIDRGLNTTYTMWLIHLATGRAIRLMLRVGQGRPALIP